jgi:hypothetical protein
VSARQHPKVVAGATAIHTYAAVLSRPDAPIFLRRVATCNKQPLPRQERSTLE